MIEPALYPPKIQSTRLKLKIPTNPQFNPPTNNTIKLIIFAIIINPSLPLLFSIIANLCKLKISRCLNSVIKNNPIKTHGVRIGLCLAGRPLSNPNTKIYIGAKWIKVISKFHNGKSNR